MNKLPYTLLTLAIAALLVGSGETVSAQNRCSDRKTPGPFKTIAFGDSVVWGQGLTPDDKFVNVVGEWLKKYCDGTDPLIIAHAGATIDPPGENDDILMKLPHTSPLIKSTLDPETLIADAPPQNIGEVNISYPTIRQQVRLAPHDDVVDLLLIDGCINDVNFRYLLNAANYVDDIEALVGHHCRDKMTVLLKEAASAYPNAKIVLTGYFPLIYKGGERRDHSNLDGSSNNLATRMAISVIRQGRKEIRSDCLRNKFGRDAERKCLAELSDKWFEASNRALSDAATAVNAVVGKRVFFAPLNFPSLFAFSTKQSMLWNVKFGATGVGGFRKLVAVLLQGKAAGDPNDKTFKERGDQCRVAQDAMSRIFNGTQERYSDKKAEGEKRSPRKQLKTSIGRFAAMCSYGSLGHPNRFGAALYAQAIIDQLRVLYPQAERKEP